jgi:hypothetical protein
MALLSKRTARDLIDSVGSLIDQDITLTSTPSRKEVVDWLNEGVIQAFRIMPIEELSDTYVSDTVLATQVPESDLSQKLLRIATVYRNVVNCKRITENEMGKVIRIAPFKYSIDDPAFALVNDGLGTKIKVYPLGATVIAVTYVPYPFIYQSDLGTEDVDADKPEDEAPTNEAIPATLEGMIIEHAAALARIQDEEPGQYQLYMSQWEKKLQTAHQLPVDSIEGV